MRRHACAILFVLATNAVAQGQLFYQEEVDALVKDVNQLTVIKPRTVRQQQQGYVYPKPTNELQIPLTPEAVVVDHNHEDHDGAHSHIHVTRLDVTCDNRGMSVKLEFDGAFNGIVYSKGHFKNRNCRYVNKDSARGDFSFVVPMSDCGTIGDDKREDHESILIIQNEESVQEVWDSAKRIRCPSIATSRKTITKTVTFNPFTVQRLTIDEPADQPKIVEETKVECWMDILVGKGPCGSVIQDKVKIGEDLNAVIYVKDGGANYDILVKDCYAHDSEDLNARDGNSVHLSDDRGCPKKEKLMGLFRKTEQTCSSGADLVAFAPISAFKFADRPDVFLTCVVELCPGGCDKCPSPSTPQNYTLPPPPPFRCTPDLFGRDPRCPTTPRPFVCTPALAGRDPRCPTTPPPFECTPALVGRDPRCPTPPPFTCTPALVGRDPRCPTTPPPFECTPALVGRDPRCPTPTPFTCTPNLIGRDERCKVTIVTPPTITTPTPFSCTPQLFGRDPRCPTPPPPIFKCTSELYGRDSRCPIVEPPPTTTTTTPKPFSCTPQLVGRDPRCPTQRPPTVRCTPDLIGNDPRCPISPPGPPRQVCTPPLRGTYPKCKPAHCEFDPAGPGCGITPEELDNHPFHIRNSGPVKPRKRISGARPSNIPLSRSRRDTSKNIIITGVGTGLHFK